MQQLTLVQKHCRHSKGVLHGDIKPANFCTGHPALQEADKVSRCSPAMHFGDTWRASSGPCCLRILPLRKCATDACILRTSTVCCSTGSDCLCPAFEHLHGLRGVIACCSLKGALHGFQASSWWLQVYIVDFGLAYTLPDVADEQQQGVNGRQVSRCRQALSDHSGVTTCVPGLTALRRSQLIMAECMSCLRVNAC